MALTTKGRPSLVPVELQVDERVCEACGATMRRSELPQPVSWSYWNTRRFCSRACQGGDVRGAASRLTALGKICTGCGEDKALDDYSPNSGGSMGRQARCKTCNAHAIKKHRAHLKATLSPADFTARRRREVLLRSCVTPERFDADCERQQGRCAICGEERVLVPDHDHAARRYRAPLCSLCNSALGFVGENPETLRLMAAYIERHQMPATTTTAPSAREEV